MESLALIVTDIDAPVGTFAHWVLYNLPPDMRELPQAIRKAEELPNGSRQGVNDFGEIGYDGPCRPYTPHPTATFSISTPSTPDWTSSQELQEGSSLTP